MQQNRKFPGDGAFLCVFPTALRKTLPKATQTTARAKRTKNVLSASD
jgi:hypothetical protein